MKRFIDFGVNIDCDGEPYRSISDIEPYIPKNHKYLIDFINKKNESKLDIMLMRINSSYKDNDIDKEAIIEEIRSLHPYFKMYGYAEACFNRTLASAVFTDNKDVPSSEIQDVFEEHMAVLPDMETDINYWLMGSDAEPLNKVIGCYKDMRLRTAIIFDDSKPKLASLQKSSRCALYNTVSGFESSILEIPTRFEYYQDKTSRLSASIEFDDDMSDLYGDILNITPEAEDMSDELYNAVSRPSQPDTDEDCSVYYVVKSFTSLLQLETYLMLQDGTRFSKCKNCGRMFTVESDGQEYCRYEDPDGSSCFSRNKRAEFEQQVSKFYRRAYKTMHDRMSLGKETREGFDRWKEEMSLLKKQILVGEKNFSPDHNPFLMPAN